MSELMADWKEVLFCLLAYGVGAMVLPRIQNYARAAARSAVVWVIALIKYWVIPDDSVLHGILYDVVILASSFFTITAYSWFRLKHNLAQGVLLLISICVGAVGVVAGAHWSVQERAQRQEKRAIMTKILPQQFALMAVNELGRIEREGIDATYTQAKKRADDAYEAVKEGMSAPEGSEARAQRAQACLDQEKAMEAYVEAYSQLEKKLDKEWQKALFMSVGTRPQVKMQEMPQPLVLGTREMHKRNVAIAQAELEVEQLALALVSAQPDEATALEAQLKAAREKRAVLESELRAAYRLSVLGDDVEAVKAKRAELEAELEAELQTAEQAKANWAHVQSTLKSVVEAAQKETKKRSNKRSDVVSNPGATTQVWSDAYAAGMAELNALCTLSEVRLNLLAAKMKQAKLEGDHTPETAQQMQQQMEAFKRELEATIASVNSLMVEFDLLESVLPVNPERDKPMAVLKGKAKSVLEYAADLRQVEWARLQ